MLNTVESSKIYSLEVLVDASESTVQVNVVEFVLQLVSIKKCNQFKFTITLLVTYIALVIIDSIYWLGIRSNGEADIGP